MSFKKARFSIFHQRYKFVGKILSNCDFYQIFVYWYAHLSLMHILLCKASKTYPKLVVVVYKRVHLNKAYYVT